MQVENKECVISSFCFIETGQNKIMETKYEKETTLY